MVRIEIVGESVEELLRQLETFKVFLPSKLSTVASESPSEPLGSDPGTEEVSTIETEPDPADPAEPAGTRKNKKTRPRKKAEPKEEEEGLQASESENVTDEAESPPMKIEEVRAVLNEAIKVGIIAADIIHKYGSCLSKISPSKYPEIVAEAKAAMEGVGK